MKKFNLDSFNIGQRLTIMAGVLSAALVVIGLLTFFSLRFAGTSSENLHALVTQSNQMARTVSIVQQDFVDTLNGINAGTLTWVDGQQSITQAREQFNQQWQVLTQGEGKFTGVGDQMALANNGVLEAFDTFLRLSETQSRSQLELFLLNDMHPLVDPFVQQAEQFSNQLVQQSEAAFTSSETTLNASLIVGSVVIIASIVGAAVISLFTVRSITRPVAIIKDALEQVKGDNPSARTGMVATADELKQLGQTLDELLDEKVETLIKIEHENERLNDSVIELLEGTSKLSDRDFTVRLSVNEDVTGPVADALNLVTREIAEALAKIRQVADLVEASANTVNEQSGKVTHVAAQEKGIVDAAIKKLDSVSEHMNQIAKWCQSSNQVAKKATDFTDRAYESVSNTISSMDEIRNSISETEKRIKRLSERSQEISSIVDIINSIAERTHVLALNASMQAAAAGEAGRGFAVVADEVQRLAESSRNSTSQISVLVRNIQTETAEAVDNMNSSITQVVQGSKLAQQAGDHMQETQTTTKELARAVSKIYEQSTVQAREAQLLRKQADKIEKSTQLTDFELRRQAEHSKRLNHASQILTETVNIFTVPEDMLAKAQIKIPEVNVEAPQPLPVAKPDDDADAPLKAVN